MAQREEGGIWATEWSEERKTQSRLLGLTTGGHGHDFESNGNQVQKPDSKGHRENQNTGESPL